MRPPILTGSQVFPRLMTTWEQIIIMGELAILNPVIQRHPRLPSVFKTNRVPGFLLNYRSTWLDHYTQGLCHSYSLISGPGRQLIGICPPVDIQDGIQQSGNNWSDDDAQRTKDADTAKYRHEYG
jgi:hypothetical protein